MNRQKSRQRRAKALPAALGAFAAMPTLALAQVTDSNMGWSPEIRSVMLGYVSNKYGISQDEANQRALVEASAARFAEHLRATATDQYAGMWIDGTGKVHLAMTDASLGRALARGEAANVDEIVAATHSLNTLEKALIRLNRLLRRKAELTSPTTGDHFTSGVDIQHNSLHLQVWRGSDLVTLAQALSGTATLYNVDIMLEQTAEPVSASIPRSCNTNVCASALGGVDIFNHALSCTAGFNATRTISGKKHYMVLTAGHCGARYNGGGTFQWEQKRPNVAALGKDYHFAFNPTDGTDWGILDMDASGQPGSGFWKPENQILLQYLGTATQTISSVANFGAGLVGQTICATGMVTGTTCGTLLKYDAGSDGAPGMGESDADTCQGDSGGPWFAGSQAIGLTSNGPTTRTIRRCDNNFSQSCQFNQDCNGGGCVTLECGPTFFSWVSKAQKSLGFNVMTSAVSWK